MQFTSAMGSFQLQRYPPGQNQTLQAWDAADEYLLHHLASHKLPNFAIGKSRVLLINDQFGALATALAQCDCVSWGDSAVAHRATLGNCKLNRVEKLPLCLPSTEQLTGQFDLVLIKVPKTLALLEHQLAGLAGHISSDSVVLAAGMVKYIHRSTLGLFESYLGTTVTSLARKKARLISPNLDQLLAGVTPDSPYPDNYHWHEAGLTLSNHANVFSRTQLDVGARSMLAVAHKLPDSSHIVDLGCGNGILGIGASLVQPCARLSFIDESYMAIASARENWAAASKNRGPDQPRADFYANDCFDGLSLDPPALVICNPPFHQDNVIGDHIAWRMLRQSYQRLQPGGQLWVVGNAHLAYHSKLKRLFGGYTEQFRDRKFVVHSARKKAGRLNARSAAQ